MSSNDPKWAELSSKEPIRLNDPEWAPKSLNKLKGDQMSLTECKSA